MNSTSNGQSTRDISLGARLVVAPHLLGTTGSHADMTQTVRSNPVLCDFMEHQYSGLGNGPDFFTAAVRREKKLGADFIKIMATGGFATPYDDPDDIQLNDAEFKAIFDTARELRIPGHGSRLRTAPHEKTDGLRYHGNRARLPHG